VLFILLKKQVQVFLTLSKKQVTISPGLGSLAGGVGGAEIGGAIAGLLGPEAIPVGMLIGGFSG
jgi:hypothetical protein